MADSRWLLDVAVVQPASFLLSKLWGGDTRVRRCAYRVHRRSCLTRCYRHHPIPQPQPTDPHAELAVTEVVVQMADTLFVGHGVVAKVSQPSPHPRAHRYASTIAKGGPRAVLLDNPSKGNVPQSPPVRTGGWLALHCGQNSPPCTPTPQLSVPAICQGVPALRHTTPTEQRVLVHTLVSQGRARLVDVPSHGQVCVCSCVCVAVCV